MESRQVRRAKLRNEANAIVRGEHPNTPRRSVRDLAKFCLTDPIGKALYLYDRSPAMGNENA